MSDDQEEGSSSNEEDELSSQSSSGIPEHPNAGGANDAPESIEEKHENWLQGEDRHVVRQVIKSHLQDLQTEYAAIKKLARKQLLARIDKDLLLLQNDELPNYLSQKKKLVELSDVTVAYYRNAKEKKIVTAGLLQTVELTSIQAQFTDRKSAYKSGLVHRLRERRRELQREKELRGQGESHAIILLHPPSGMLNIEPSRYRAQRGRTVLSRQSIIRTRRTADERHASPPPDDRVPPEVVPVRRKKRATAVTSNADGPYIFYMLEDDEIIADLNELGIRTKRVTYAPAYLKDHDL